MQLITSIHDMKVLSRQIRDAGKTLGLVPTMGALHEGHFSLIRRAKSQCDATVVSIFVKPGPLATRWEGASRPGHFRGVTTVVLKLFHVVSPDFAYFGQKDFQQAMVILRLVRDLNLDVRLVLCPIIRDSDGVA